MQSGKRAGEFSSPIPLFHDLPHLTEKDFAAGKRFFVNKINLCLQARFPCAAKSPRASLVGSATPHANARHVAVSPRHTNSGYPLFYEECRSSQFVAAAGFAVSRTRESLGKAALRSRTKRGIALTIQYESFLRSGQGGAGSPISRRFYGVTNRKICELNQNIPLPQAVPPEAPLRRPRRGECCAKDL